MLIETIALGITFAQAWKANDLDNKSLNTLKKAYDTHANAIALFERHKQDADASLRKLVNRKKGILSTRMNRFVSVYQHYGCHIHGDNVRKRAGYQISLYRSRWDDFVRFKAKR